MSVVEAEVDLEVDRVAADDADQLGAVLTHV
jgi:hypothetical protein